MEEDEEEEDTGPKTKTIRETVWEWERINDIKAIWYRSKDEIEEEEAKDAVIEIDQTLFIVLIF